MHFPFALLALSIGAVVYAAPAAHAEQSPAISSTVVSNDPTYLQDYIPEVNTDSLARRSLETIPGEPEIPVNSEVLDGIHALITPDVDARELSSTVRNLTPTVASPLLSLTYFRSTLMPKPCLTQRRGSILRSLGRGNSSKLGRGSLSKLGRDSMLSNLGETYCREILERWGVAGSFS